MTLMSSISKLTTSVDQLAGETNVTKAQLNAKVAQADAEIVAAQAEQTATEAARDEAAAHAADAATHLATVKANVTYEGIGAVLAEKAVTAVDIFIYDTSLDSDGGAWRKRCQQTSWYSEELNTATRGARRAFPAVAVIVAEAGKVTIYDGDDPTLPMWLVFNGHVSHSIFLGYSSSGGFSVSMVNGQFCFGAKGITTNGSINAVGAANFVADSLEKWDEVGHFKSHQGIVHRNDLAWASGLGWWSPPKDGSKRIVNQYVNDVAVTVLPNAPVDPTTGLPVPTIAVATAGGLSIIKDDGSVVDVVNYITAPPTVSFASVGGLPRIVATSRYSNWVFVIDVPIGDINSGAFLDSLEIGGAAAFFSEFTDDDGVIHAATNRGLKLYAKDQGFVGANKNAASMPMSAIIRSGSTSGWMMRSTAGSFLSDTSATPLVEPPEIVVNGGFDADINWGKGPGWSIGDGVVSIDGTQTSNSNLTQTLSPVFGQTYAIRVKMLARGGGASAYFYWGTASFGSITQPGEYTFYRTWLGGTSILYFTVNAGVTITMDDISVVAVDENRSPSSAGLFVNGTITRSPVADGAELVGYSGFSAANYLEQPYNSALDFGTGDFSIMGWVKQSSIAANQVFLAKANAAGTSVFSFFTSGSSGHLGYFHPTSGTVSSGKALALNAWNHIGLVRKGGIVTFCINGVGVFSTTHSAFDLTRTNDDILRLGRDFSVNVAGNSILALWRVSATAPTADQVAKIYEDERKLFQPGAACTLFGTNDAVMALAHDPKTSLLHVGTSQGRSVFDGLVRVANTENPVTTAISAVGGMIAEQ